MNNEFAMSLNGRCLAEGYAERMRALPKVVFGLRHDPFHHEGESRKFARVSVKGHDYWADAITGSLYDCKTGRCLTGNASIKV